MADIRYVDWYKFFAGKEVGVFAHVSHYRFSNFSAVDIGGGDLLFAVKGLTINREPEGDFWPGNRAGAEFSENEGCDYWWNRWSESRGGVVFFVGKSIRGPLRVVPVHPRSECRLHSGVLLEGDIRLFSMGGDIFASTPKLKVYRVDYRDDELVLSRFTSASCGLGDKNMSVLEVSPLCYLDWFRESGVVVKRLGDVGDRHVIRYGDSLGLVGRGSSLGDIYRPRCGGRSYEEFVAGERVVFGRNFGQTPQFCFGSPSTKVRHPNFGEGYLGVGHLKIRNEPKYVYSPGSSIALFRESLHHAMRQSFGQKYIRHYGGVDGEGYIYMAFFHFMPEDMSEMFLSDAFLPFARSSQHGPFDQEYRFSLCFPTSLGIDGERLWFSAGEGDWYSLWAELGLEEVWRSLRHKVSDLSMSEYRYSILLSSDLELPDCFEGVGRYSLME